MCLTNRLFRLQYSFKIDPEFQKSSRKSQRKEWGKKRMTSIWFYCVTVDLIGPMAGLGINCNIYG